MGMGMGWEDGMGMGMGMGCEDGMGMGMELVGVLDSLPDDIMSGNRL